MQSKFRLICTFWAATCHMTRFGSINDWWTWLDNPLPPGRGKTTGILKLGVVETTLKKKKHKQIIHRLCIEYFLQTKQAVVRK